MLRFLFVGFDDFYGMRKEIAVCSIMASVPILTLSVYVHFTYPGTISIYMNEIINGFCVP